MKNFKGAGRLRTPAAISNAAASIKVETAAMQAIIAVETRGTGFDAKGRPKMLFEPHRFYKELKDKPAELAFAVKAGLAYPSWGEKPYPRDSYPRLAQAIALDETAALRAASWGLGQILGSNHESAGYPSPQAMVAAFMNSEDAQIEAMVGFIRGNGLVAAVRAKDWAKVARGYNGKLFAKGEYDLKLKNAYKARPAWEKTVPTLTAVPPPMPEGVAVVVPTPPAPASVQPAPLPPEPAVAVPAPVSVDPMLMKVQQQLQDAGFPVGGIDGKWGEMTRTALAGFKASYNETTEADLALDNSYGPDVQLALLNWKRPVAPERAEATAGDLIKKGDAPVTLLTRIRNWLGIAPIGVVAVAKSGVVEQVQDASEKFVAVRDALAPFAPVWSLVVNYWWLAVPVAAGGVIYWATVKRRASVAEFNVGLRP